MRRALGRGLGTAPWGGPWHWAMGPRAVSPPTEGPAGRLRPPGGPLSGSMPETVGPGVGRGVRWGARSSEAVKLGPSPPLSRLRGERRQHVASGVPEQRPLG